jgi:hypothetical protein
MEGDEPGGVVGVYNDSVEYLDGVESPFDEVRRRDRRIGRVGSFEYRS